MVNHSGLMTTYNCIAEIMDFGYPQNLSPEILKLYITQEGVRSPFSSKVSSMLLLIQNFDMLTEIPGVIGF